MRAFIIVALFSSLFACQNRESGSEKRAVEEITDEALINNSDIIRMPVEGGKLDTTKVAKMTFAEYEYDFGEVSAGETVTKVFEFTNTGKSALVISNAQSTCGCTVPEFPREAIPPGKKGKITVKFDTSGKAGPQTKPVTITANTYPSTTVVQVVGLVKNNSSE
jgi:Protein of unknown function (DUF1573)